MLGRSEKEHSRCFPYESKDFELEPQFAISLGCDPCKMAEHTRHTPSRLVSHLVSRFPQHACPPLSPRLVFLLSNFFFYRVSLVSRLGLVSSRCSRLLLCLVSCLSCLVLSRVSFSLSLGPVAPRSLSPLSFGLLIPWPPWSSSSLGLLVFWSLVLVLPVVSWSLDIVVP